ncbi:pilus assembly PilX family protein [Variovorax sp. DT-64]|uniref:pilus assembly PilX family protein n=1 Tax=Variovorax sp. DT-64 TaxID=3396160 RepID=UPI003F198CAC
MTPSRQRGAALIVGLIMLVLITLTVVVAFNVSISNLKSVGNMQTRNEAVAAANRAIEEVAASLLPPNADGTPSMVAPVATASLVDINNDGKTDYTVQVAPPTCARVTKASGGGGGGTRTGPGGITGGGSTSGSGLTTVPDQYNAVWDISTTVTDDATGASIAVRQGVRVLMSQAQFEAFCP